MPVYKLHYFKNPRQGRAELSRLILSQAGVEFQDIRFSHCEWPAIKPSKFSTTLILLFVCCVLNIQHIPDWLIVIFHSYSHALWPCTDLGSGRSSAGPIEHNCPISCQETRSGRKRRVGTGTGWHVRWQHSWPVEWYIIAYYLYSSIAIAIK